MLISRGRTAPAISNQPRLIISIENSSKIGPPPVGAAPPPMVQKGATFFQLSVSAYRNSAKHFRYVQNRYSTSHVRTSAINIFRLHQPLYIYFVIGLLIKVSNSDIGLRYSLIKISEAATNIPPRRGGILIIIIINCFRLCSGDPDMDVPSFVVDTF